MEAAALNFGEDDNRPIKLFFEDEGRFGRSNNLSRCRSLKDLEQEYASKLFDSIHTHTLLSALKQVKLIL